MGKKFYLCLYFILVYIYLVESVNKKLRLSPVNLPGTAVFLENFVSQLMGSCIHPLELGDELGGNILVVNDD